MSQHYELILFQCNNLPSPFSCFILLFLRIIQAGKYVGGQGVGDDSELFIIQSITCNCDLSDTGRYLSVFLYFKEASWLSGLGRRCCNPEGSGLKPSTLLQVGFTLCYPDLKSSIKLCM